MPRERKGLRSSFDLHLPNSRSAIHDSLGEILRRVASNDIDPRRAGLLLYSLQVASTNLKAAEQNQRATQTPQPAADFEMTTEEPEETDHNTSEEQAISNAGPIHPRPDDPVRGTPISKGTFYALLESPARHNGVDHRSSAIDQPQRRIRYPLQPQSLRGY